MIQKCTSWLGHKFEGRYDEYMPDGMEIERATISALRTLKTFEYKCDICVRCGWRIEKNDPA